MLAAAADDAAAARSDDACSSCRLPQSLLELVKLRYDLGRWDLVAAAREALRCGELLLPDLAHPPADHPARRTPPRTPDAAFEEEVRAMRALTRRMRDIGCWIWGMINLHRGVRIR